MMTEYYILFKNDLIKLIYMLYHPVLNKKSYKMFELYSYKVCTLSLPLVCLYQVFILEPPSTFSPFYPIVIQIPI